MIINDIQKSIKKAFKSEFSIELDEIELAFSQPQFGDFALSCHKFAKDLKISPQEIAIKLSESIKDKIIAKTEAVAGYLNIFVDSAVLNKEVLSEIIDKDRLFGSVKCQVSSVKKNFPDT